VLAFQSALAAAEKLAQAGHLVTLGMKPSFASTGFGYIEQGSRGIPVDELTAYEVTDFTEKPGAETAEAMLSSGNFAWNGGMFIWRADRILAEFERQMPGLYAQLMEIAAALGTPDYESVLARIWPTVESETIDYGIMEGAADVVVLPVEIGWSDVGSWASVFDVRPADSSGNILLGRHESVDTTNTLVYGGKRVVATIGVDNLIIVDTPDAVLICQRGHEQDVKAIVNRLKAAGDETLY
jgi:mannose-1-phosphate guanylyltransferase